MESIRAVFTDYNGTIDTIGEERIEERFLAIGEIYNIFLGMMNLNHQDIKLNKRTVMHAVLDYFTDIIRLKEFHGIEKINQDKIIAYECSWLLRRKPIQILKDNDERLIYINEKFILSIFVEHLTSNSVDKLDGNDTLRILCDMLLYYLKYRNCEAKIFEMFIMFFKAGNSIRKIDYS